MPEATTVVNKERYAQGLIYQEFLAQAKVNLDKFAQYYESGKISADDAAFFKKVATFPNGPAKMLVLGEDWCPDVFRGLPVMARIAEASGMELRVFPRDKNMDIMNEFLYQGQFQSIPTLVFYTGEQKYLCHWIERPQMAYKEMAEMREQMQREMPNATDRERMGAMRDRMFARYPAWQQETVRELRELLSKTLGLS